MAPIAAQELAEHVVTEGFAAQKDGLHALYESARAKSVSGVLLEVVADEQEPRPVRERALGRIVIHLCRAA